MSSVDKIVIRIWWRSHSKVSSGLMEEKRVVINIAIILQNSSVKLESMASEQRVSVVWIIKYSCENHLPLYT